MGKNTYGNAQTIYTSCRGLYGVRARINLPSVFAANGRDAAHYLDAYVAIFTDDLKTAFVEAGPMFYGEYQQDKPTSPRTPALFAHRWSIGVNPLGGAFLGQRAQGERNVLYVGPKSLIVELTVLAKDQAEVEINGKSFKTLNDFTFGFGGRGVESTTFDKGFNVKACIGLNDEEGKGVHFEGLSIEIMQVLRKTAHGPLWESPPSLHRRFPLRNTKTMVRGQKLIVTYPRPGSA